MARRWAPDARGCVAKEWRIPWGERCLPIPARSSAFSRMRATLRAESAPPRKFRKSTPSHSSSPSRVPATAPSAGRFLRQGQNPLPPHGEDPLLAPLSQNPDGPLLQQNVFSPKRDEFADAQPRRIEKLEDRGVTPSCFPLGGKRAQEVHHLVHRKKFRQSHRPPGGCDSDGGIPRYLPPRHQEGEEGPQRRDLPGHGRSLPSGEPGCEIPPQVRNRHRLPPHCTAGGEHGPPRFRKKIAEIGSLARVGPDRRARRIPRGQEVPGELFDGGVQLPARPFLPLQGKDLCNTRGVKIKESSAKFPDRGEGPVRLQRLPLPFSDT